MSKLFKRKNSPYYYYISGGASNRIKKSTGTTDLILAKKIQKKWDEDIILNKHGISVDIMLYELIDKYVDMIFPLKSESWQGRGHCSIKAIKKIINDIPIINIKKININEYIIERLKVVKPATIRKEVWLLSKILEFAVDNEYLNSNPATNITLPQAKPKQYPPFSKDTLHYLFKNGEKQDVLYWKILYYTGMSAGDGGTIRKSNLKQDVLIMKRGKTNIIATVPLHPELKHKNIFMVMPYKRDRDLSRRHLRKLLAELNLEGSLTTFRHTLATHLEDAGLSREDIKGILGHTTSTMTSNYIHSNITRAKEYINKI